MNFEIDCYIFFAREKGKNHLKTFFERMSLDRKNEIQAMRG